MIRFMIMRIAIIYGFIVTAGFVAVGCSGTASPTAFRKGAQKVVVSFYPLAWLAEQEGGRKVDVHNLTPAGAEPHDLELKPSDVAEIHDADVVIYMGRGFQPAVEQALAGSHATKVDVLRTPGLDLAKPPAGSGAEGAKLGVDPHVWLDPRRLELIADYVAGKLHWDAAAVDGKLGELDARFAAGLTHCSRHQIFTSHSAFGYLAQRYGLQQVAITGLSPEAEPLPRDLERVAKQAKQARATTIFFETLVSPKLSRQVAGETGAITAVLDPLEGIKADRLARGADYPTVMAENLAALQKGLGCG